MIFLIDVHRSDGRKTFEPNSAVRHTPDTETGHFQYFPAHWVSVQFFHGHSATDGRHVQLVQLVPAERDRRYFFRGDFQFAQQLPGGTAHVQHLFSDIPI